MKRLSIEEKILVEIEANIIEIANQYFDLDKIGNLEIVIGSVFKFALKIKFLYDLIIIGSF